MHQMSSQPMKHTTHKRTQWSQIIKENGQYQWKYTYQLQQSDVAHHTKHTPLNTINVHYSQNPPSLQNTTTDVVIQQHSRKLLMMDILMSETCWTHKKWNKIASDIKLVFYSSSLINLASLNNMYFQIIYFLVIRDKTLWDMYALLKHKVTENCKLIINNFPRYASGIVHGSDTTFVIVEITDPAVCAV